MSQKCAALTDLSMCSMTISRAQFRSILHNCPNITSISMLQIQNLAAIDSLEDLTGMCPQVTSLSLGGFLRDTQYPVLATKFRRLKKVRLEAPPVVFLDHMFTTVTPLEELQWSGVYLQDPALLRILRHSPNLRILRNSRILRKTRILTLVSECHELRELDYTSDCNGINKTMALVAEKCTKLETLTIRDGHRKAEVALASIANHCVHSLLSFRLIGCGWGDNGHGMSAASIIEIVRQCTKLTHIHLLRFAISAPEMCIMVSYCPQLLSLKLTSPYKPLDSTVIDAVCSHLKRLKVFHLSGNQGIIKDTYIMKLLRVCTPLQSLRIAHYNQQSFVVNRGFVQTIDKYGANLRELRLGWCSHEVHMSLTGLREKRMQNKVMFNFSTSSMNLPKGCWCIWHNCWWYWICAC